MSKKCKAYSASKLGLEAPDTRKAFYAGWDAAIEAALTPGEPVAYQYRMRPTWGSRGANWGPWEECSRGKYEDCKKAPVVNDWEHEARALYTAAQPQPKQEPREHITDGSPCWCNPEVDYIDPETGAAVIVHRRPQ